jgi:HEAT repeat protein
VALRGDDPRVRAEAARAAEAIADPAFAAPLLYALPRERDPAARTALIKALALYPGRATVESLVRQMPEDIEGLKPTAEFDRSILLEARRSLVCATGEDFGLDAVAWRLWWEKSGKSRWP